MDTWTLDHWGTCDFGQLDPFKDNFIKQNLKYKPL